MQSQTQQWLQPVESDIDTIAPFTDMQLEIDELAKAGNNLEAEAIKKLMEEMFAKRAASADM